MEAGIENLEQLVVEAGNRLMRIETRLDETATKADLHKGIADMIRWVVGTAIVLSAAAITVMTFVLNYATPPRSPPALVTQAAPAVQPTPIIIQLPPYPAPAPRQ